MGDVGIVVLAANITSMYGGMFSLTNCLPPLSFVLGLEQGSAFRYLGKISVKREDSRRRAFVPCARTLSNLLPYFYRLNVFPVELPPLRKRREDIPVLVSCFLNRYARKTGRDFKAVDKKSMDRLEGYDWPGNIRELQNVIERSVIVSETQTFSVDESWFSRRPSPNEVNVQPSLFNRLPAQEKAAIEAALRECGGRVYGPTGAAAKLGIPRTTLESKIRALKINKSRFKPDPLKDS